ncbi:MAG: VOC family protein [Haliea sp.]
MAEVTELGYLSIGVSDLGQWKEFAEKIVGGEWVEAGDPKKGFIRLDEWHHRIDLLEDGSDDLRYAGLRVAGADEFRAMHKRLVDAGLSVEMLEESVAEERHVLELMRLEDPSGTPLEIFHGPHVQMDKPFYPGRRLFGLFKTGRGGLGHVMFRQSASLEETYQFYRLLGMRGGIEYKAPLPGTDERLKVLFMHCIGGTRDHSLSFGVPSEKRIHHLMLEYEKFNDIGLARQIVKQRGHEVGMELGKHANDDMYSFYIPNPSGWMQELGWGGSEPTHQSEYYEGDTFGHEATDLV